MKPRDLKAILMSDELLKDDIELKNGKLSMSVRDFNTIFKLSGSKAKSKSGKTSAVKRTLEKAIRLLIKEY